MADINDQAQMNEGFSSPQELLELARAVPDRPHGPTPTDYVGVISLLRRKGMTWTDIGAWLKENRSPWSLATLRKAYDAAPSPEVEQ